MSLPTPPRACNERHQMLQFLDVHLQHGGLEQHSHAMLRRVVRLINHMSHCLFPPALDFGQDKKQRVRLLCKDILTIFDVFGEHLAFRHNYAQKADGDLPDLAVPGEHERRERLEEWRLRLDGAHNPDENDVKMYMCFRMYYDEHIWLPFLQLHQANPEHGSWELQSDLAFIQECLELLHDICEAANKLVDELDREYAHGLRTLDRVADMHTPKRVRGAVTPPNPRMDTGSLKFAEIRVKARFAYQQLCALDDFFESDCTASPEDVAESFDTVASLGDNSYSIASGIGTPLITTRPNTPDCGRGSRVFTGSFSDLEESIKNLFAEPQVKIKDFAIATPRLLPSPATLLERRDALSVREAEWDHRYVAGRLVKSRRPHDRQRARTIDDISGGLDAWLSEDSSYDQTTLKAVKAGMRRLERQCTI